MINKGLRALERLSRPVKWGLLLFLLHSLVYVVLFNGRALTGIEPEQNLSLVLALLEFWWFLPLSLVIMPLSSIVDFKTLFFYSLWNHYGLVVLILAGSFVYGCLGYCVGITQRAGEE